MATSLFVRLLGVEDKEPALRQTVQDLNAGQANGNVYSAELVSLRLIPGSPFAYWVSDALRRKFRELPRFEGGGRTVKQGLATADDFRFVRAWWEVPPERILHVPARAEDLGDPEALRRYQEVCREATRRGQYWVPFAKGGEYSPYYADVHLVVNWRDDGEEIKSRINPNTRKLYSNVWQLKQTEREYFFRPGLTWTRRTQKGFNMRTYSAGSIFADKGPVAFVPVKELGSFLGIANSIAFSGLISLQMAFGSFEVGVIQRTPLPPLARSEGSRLGKLALYHFHLKRSLDTADEPSRSFIRPALFWVPKEDLFERCKQWEMTFQEERAKQTACQHEIDKIVYGLYGIRDEDRRAIEASATEKIDPATEECDDEKDIHESEAPSTDHPGFIAAVLSYAVGCAFGRWDVRVGRGDIEPPPLPGPFDPLPRCSPGMLVGGDGLLGRAAPADYPIRVPLDGILVDDPGHPADIVARVRQVLAHLFSDGDPAALEEEAWRLLGVKDLRDWLRNNFFPYHIRMYSKSRRKAPIFWQLCSSRKNYSVWLYYHRLNHDTLFTVLRSYVEPKIQYEEQKARETEERLAAARTAGNRREEHELARRAEAQERLLEELSQFRDQISTVAHMGYDPDLDDGVLLNIAPLYQVVPWKEAAKAWQELQAGKYPWSSMAKRLGLAVSGGKRSR